MRHTSRKNVLEKQDLYSFDHSSDVHWDCEGFSVPERALKRPDLYVHIMEYHSTFKKEEGNPAICNNMDGSGRYSV